MVQLDQSNCKLKNLGLRGNHICLSVQNKTHAICMWDHTIVRLNNHFKDIFFFKHLHLILIQLI